MDKITPKQLYSHNVLFTVRCFAVTTLLLLGTALSISIPDLIKTGFYSVYPRVNQIQGIITIIINIIVSIFAIILIFHPQRFFLIGIGGLLYSLFLSYFGGQNAMGIMMLSVAISTFVIRYGNNKSKKFPVIFFGSIYILELLFPLFRGAEEYYVIVMQKFGLTFTLIISIYFFSEYAKHTGINQGTNEKILNLALYPGLERSDLSLLQEVLNNVKYKEIARKLHGSEGALRNKLSRLYKILEVGDRTGFITLYSGYELVYESISEPVLEKN